MVALAATQAQAGISEAYLFSAWSSPANESVPAFNFTGTTGVKLLLNGSGVATGRVTAASQSVDVNFAFEYLSNTGTINAGEGFAQNSAGMAARVNREIGRLDDAAFVNEGDDAPLNLDFDSKGASVILKKFDLPITHIVIAEDAGLDAFKLEWDADGDFGAGAIVLFNGFNSATQTAILNRTDFSADDYDQGDIDQIYVFKFDQALAPGYLRVKEIGNPDKNSSRLEIDFAGAHVVPEPSAVVLVAAGMSFVGMIIRRRR